MSYLKQQIQADLKTLKSLDLDILPARIYYREMLKLFTILWGSFLGIQLIAAKAINTMGVWQDYFQRYAEHESSIIGKMWLGCIVSSFVISLFLLSRIKLYVIFKHQIRDSLQTGLLLTRKMRQMACIFYGLFVFFIFPCTLFCDPDVTLFAALGAFIFTALASQFLIGMELTRIGVGVLLEAVSALFNKNEKSERSIT